MHVDRVNVGAPRPDAGAAPLACFLCGGTDFSLLVIGYDRMRASADDHRYMRCTACGLVRLTPLPAPERIAALYPDEYHARIAPIRKNFDTAVNRLAIRYCYGVDSVSRSRLPRYAFRMLSGRILNGFREPYGANRLLDVGCGSGAILETYRRLGWSVCGIEIDPGATATCRERGLDVHRGTLFDAPLPGRQFDLILFSHVIEHVLQPAAELRRAAEFLAPGGRIIVTTPNIQGIGFRLYGSCWYPLEAPRHLFLFDPYTIRRLGAQAGLTVHRAITQSVPWTLCKSRHYVRTQGQRLPQDLTRRRAIIEQSVKREKSFKTYRALMAPFTRLTAACGQGDIMEVEFTAGGARCP